MHGGAAHLCSGIGTNGLSRRFVFGLIQRKLTVFDFLQFGLDVQQVMTNRIFRMMAGELSPREVRRMITEKQAAYSHAHIAGAYALLTGGPVEAGREMIKVYQTAVSANCARLSKAR
ncbi:MAG: hypothetical protein ABSB77_00320 [Xanthobacteraceae bacterium]|jgi:hypothetical protein